METPQLSLPFHLSRRGTCAGAVVNKRTVWRLSIFTDIFWGIVNLVHAL